VQCHGGITRGRHSLKGRNPLSYKWVVQQTYKPVIDTDSFITRHTISRMIVSYSNYQEQISEHVQELRLGTCRWMINVGELDKHLIHDCRFTVAEWLTHVAATLEVKGSRPSLGDISEIYFLKSIQSVAQSDLKWSV